MKKKVLFYALICALHVTITQTNSDFQRRFGSESTIYNQPLYFSTQEVKKRDNRPRKSFRTQIRERMHRGK
jgi:hypothetical protein